MAEQELLPFADRCVELHGLMEEARKVKYRLRAHGWLVEHADIPVGASAGLHCSGRG